MVDDTEFDIMEADDASRREDDLREAGISGEVKPIDLGPMMKVPTNPGPIALSAHAAKDAQFMQLMTVAITEGKTEELKMMMELQAVWEAKEAKKAFYEALSKFQSSIPPIPKSGRVSYDTDGANGPSTTAYSFGRLEDIAKAIRPSLELTGLSYRYTQSNDGGAITVGCVVTHKMGHSETLEMVSNADASGKKNAIQAIASAVSYMRRYTLTGSFGLTVEGEDTDGQDYQESTKEPDCMPEDQFKAGFSKWEALILAGTKTPDEIIGFINSKGGYLSQPQLDAINKVGNTQ